ncbi:polysaccharide biosynthesis/export family protein [Phyllobacterium endophyticum]|jgi:exopolysaccharide production protein ExoF|uniref:Sugar ABC transporter substrate-binding protein n=1 Tax=Phyllobacterium endophyticum TaxID=1149773 RepID=A0A2P7B0D7_9HYPH|nr:polysaccharide biosynthesis/export family protein [Phyllobacterium endophyticum]MBB3235393.1 exopolysaccharide production protein ExoF [Phyllobacterium endophyticum]PSH59937.1 sugar ABC transporter substrate-binding protein [Phyllobacterium endophyticum]TXR50014.1 sugar ABC transporter substrate-binding protein [Phyllobacterium endophyticum]TYR42100.1 sugar ABC transporter substrate-binding protein [Phyllobacterium endophyticum]
MIPISPSDVCFAVQDRFALAFRVLGGCLLLLALMYAPAARAADYELGPMDKVTVRVVEWQTAEGTFREWPTITGDYRVGPSGTLSLPFAGEIEAGGKTTSDIAKEIAKNLRQKLGLVDLPEASVEISEFRPIFVSGDVQTPGKYAFEPEMTVLKAVSLAGGMPRSAGQRFERDYFNARGDYDVIVAQHDRLVVKLARLQAELANAQEIKVPDDLIQKSEAKRLIADEVAIMQSRKSALDLQLNGLNELKTLYTNEISSLEKKMDVQNRQMDLTRKELKSIGGLADQGLVVNSRVMGLQTSVADMEGKLLDLDTASLRAKQEINKSTQNETDLQNERKAELANEIQATQAALDESNLKLQMNKNLMTEALVNAPAAAGQTNNSDVAMQYSIVRTSKGKTEEVSAEEGTTLLPGDVVKVKIDMERS